jgi:hypothetical protein
MSNQDDNLICTQYGIMVKDVQRAIDENKEEINAVLKAPAVHGIETRLRSKQPFDVCELSVLDVHLLIAEINRLRSQLEAADKLAEVITNITVFGQLPIAVEHSLADYRALRSATTTPDAPPPTYNNKAQQEWSNSKQKFVRASYCDKCGQSYGDYATCCSTVLGGS